MARLAIAGAWHVHAADFAREIAALPGATLVSCWDDDADRGAALADQFGAMFISDLKSFLAQSEIDGVIVTTPTVDHVWIIPRLLDAGFPVLTEKVLAPTLRGALDLRSAALQAARPLAVALPRAGTPPVLAMRRSISEGVVGTVSAVRVRLAHDGQVPSVEQPDGWLPAHFVDPDLAGGGALIDLGAHPLYLCRLLLGPIDRVTATTGAVSGSRADDNAAALLSSAGGGLGVAETSFVDGARSFRIEVHGTLAALTWDAAEEGVVVVRRGGGRRRIAPAELPAAAPSPLVQWLDAIERGESKDASLPLAVELSALSEAAARSIAEARAVRMSEIDGWTDWLAAGEAIE